MRRFLILLLMGIVVVSCKKQFDSLTNFKIDYEQSATVESSVGINLPFNVATPPVETNSESEFKTQNTRADLVEEIHLTALSCEITSPSNSDFSFLEEVTIYINADGLNERKVAWKTPVPSSGSNTLVLDCTEADLQEYIKKEKFSLRLNAVTDELITQDHQLKILSSFNVKAKLTN